jgi:prevent-host-death family protein
MSKVELTTASEPLSKYARKARNDPVIVVKDGTPLAAVVPVRNTDEKAAALSTSGKFLKIIERSRSRFKKEGGGISAKGIWRRLRIDD